MLTRRNILIGAAVTGAATLTRSLSSSLAENSQHISPIKRILNLLPVWVPEAAKRRTILVDNPAKLYGF